MVSGLKKGTGPCWWSGSWRIQFRSTTPGKALRTLAATAASIASLGLLGRIIDRMGAVRTIQLCALILTLVPLPWVVFENHWLLMRTMAASGFAWSGLTPAAFVYYLGSVDPRTRVTAIAYVNVLSLFFAFVGATLDDWLAGTSSAGADRSLSTNNLSGKLFASRRADLDFCTLSRKKRCRRGN